jgi:ubiquinone/menaquinone biosynthesis C-methylase UbiE
VAVNTYSKFAAVYDTLYSFKNYAKESDRVLAIISDRKRSQGHSLLDVACGTGGHIEFLRRNYQIEGLDLSENMLEIARAKYPDITFHREDMRNFDLGRKYDAIVCLFSAIGYAKTERQMRNAIAAMANHLERGGVLIVEPWFPPTQQFTGIHALFVDKPDLKIARMDIPRVSGNVSIIRFHMMVGTPQGIEEFSETHEMGLFTHEEYIQAFLDAGLEVKHDQQGLMGRGLYIGVAPIVPIE